MPTLGDIKNGLHIGFTNSNRYIWAACIKCGKQRWVKINRDGNPKSRYCKNCVLKDAVKPKGEQSANWHGGKVKNGPYFMVIIYPDNPFFVMARKANSHPKWHTYYVEEHRLIMAKHLGRCLTSDEIVHHKNGVKDDNRIENLYLTERSKHKLGFGEAFQEGYELGYKKGYWDAIMKSKQEVS